MIMIVDDEQDMRELLAIYLEKNGFSSVGFGSGAQAADYYREHHSDIELVVLDVVMPGMRGDACYDKLHEINPQVKAIVLSGYAAPKLRTQLEDKVPVFQKPLSFKDFVLNIKKILK